MLSQLERMQQHLEATPYLLRIGRLFSEAVLLQVDDDEYHLTFEKVHLAQIARGPSKKPPYRFAFHTDADAVARFWEYRPALGLHDIFRLVKIGRTRPLSYARTSRGLSPLLH